MLEQPITPELQAVQLLQRILQELQAMTEKLDAVIELLVEGDTK